MTLLLLISGPIAVGKTTVARALIERQSFRKISSGEYLKVAALGRGLETSRSDLQTLGDLFDRETDYRWLIDEVVAPALAGNSNQSRWFVDAVRKQRQVEHFRDQFNKAVFHVHLTADEAKLEQRYNTRLVRGGEYEGCTSYAVAKDHPNEVVSRSLIEIADFVLPLDDIIPDEGASIIVEKWGANSNASDCSD